MQSFIALGSNIEPRKDTLIKALAQLDDQKQINITNQSSIYETVPIGYTEQSDFLNMVIETETSLSPPELLETCHEIENALGRERDIRFGPRTIDLDILLYNREIRQTRLLSIPHPRMHQRAFVLIPLAEIAPSYQLPTGESIHELIEGLPDGDKAGVSKWSEGE